MRCGDVAVTTNGVTWTVPCELPFAHDGFCQDDEWVAANFTNAADWTATVEAPAAGGEVVVEARFNEDAIQPRFVLPVVPMRQIPIEAYVVCDQTKRAATAEQINDKLAFANKVFRQVGVAFYLSDVPLELVSPRHFNLAHHSLYTNAVGVIGVRKRISNDVRGLLSLAPSNGCIRMFCVNELINSQAEAFSLTNIQAMVVSKNGSERVLAHELGHMLGLVDIYDHRRIGNVDMPIPGASDLICKNLFDDMAHDWRAETASGFYSSADTHLAVMKSFLMYGYDTANTANGVDMPSGGFVGYPKKPNGIFDTAHLPVGAHALTLP